MHWPDLAQKKGYLLIMVALVILLVLVFRLILSAGVLFRVEPHFDGSCEAVEGLWGAEDITVDQESGFAYISADDRRARMSGQDKAGALFVLDLNDPSSVPVNLTTDQTDSFHPHGISLYRGVGGEKRLFVVNHPRQGQHQVEIFSIASPLHLQFQETVSYPGLRSPNDLVAIGERQFYVTNDHYYPPGVMRLFEDFLGLPLSSVSFFDGAQGNTVASGFRYANGITIAPDGSRVYVAETTGRNLVVMDRDVATGGLSNPLRVKVGTGADNLEWHAEDVLLLTGHPRLFDFMAHAESHDALSPSQVLQLDLRGSEPVIAEIYLNDGTEISGASVAASYKDTLLIGAVFEEKLLRCSYPP